MNVEDSLRLELEAERHAHRKDNEFLLAQVAALRQQLADFADDSGLVPRTDRKEVKR